MSTDATARFNIAGLLLGVFLLVAATTVVCGETYYVWTDSPVDGPGTAWSNAFHSIHTAMWSATSSGDTVLVTNGSYQLAAPYRTININKDIALRSVNGPLVTTIIGEGGQRCLYLYDVACVVSGFTVTNGYSASDNGGGLYCLGSQPVVTNCVIAGNHSGVCGGGMYKGAVYDSAFINNTADDDGGGMYGGPATLCRFKDNFAVYSGGGMYASGHAVISCTFSNNNASGGGGLYYGVVRNSTFLKNTAGQGGGMNYGSASNCTFHSNTATQSGGGVFDSSAVDCVISNNISSNAGGGMFGGTASNCKVIANEAASGGGVYNGTINNSLLCSNTATYHGGGIHSGMANDCTIISNMAGSNGGGGYETTANRSLISANKAEFGGGIYYSTLNSSLVVSNTAHQQGGGMYYAGTANNCTFIYNTADTTGGVGFYGTANNCIIWYNTNGNISDLTCRYCCSPGVTHGVDGCITNAPRFVEATGNYRLQATSPCVDMADNSYQPPGPDFEGTPRPLDGDNNGTNTVDMGCNEFVHALADSDGDTMRDGWENDHGLDPSSSADSSENPDSDPHNNLQEFIADTDPFNPSDYLRITGISNNSPVIISFESSANRLYSMIGCSNLLDAVWSQIPGCNPRTGGGGPDSMQDTNSLPATRFYKVQVELP